jgi:cyclic pyranopterin monophosphate synthase
MDQMETDAYSGLTHFNAEGRARMVDVSDKPDTKRSATASCVVQMKPETMERIKQGRMTKGDVLAVAQVAGIMAAKRTPEWIPMCHPIAISGVDIRFVDDGLSELTILATITTTGPTGVEMEALTAVLASALTVYDMCKAVDKEMTISSAHLLTKTGGKSGDYSRSM